MSVFVPFIGVRDAAGVTHEHAIPLHKLDATAAPTVNDDSGDGYTVGSQWCDTTNDTVWECTDNTLGAALWKRLDTGGSGTGDVVGPASATDGHFSQYDGATGKLIKDGGYAPASFAAATHATTHKSGGGDAIKLDELAAPTDVTTLNASTTLHGLLKKLDNNAAHYMDGQGNWSTPAGSGGDVTAAAAFATDNVVIRSDGTGKGVQKSGITVSDVDEIAGALSVAIKDNATSYPVVIGCVSSVTQTASHTLTIDIANADVGLTLKGSITIAGSFVTTGGGLTFTLSGATNVSLPTAGTLATIAGSETFTNKTLTTPTIGSFTNANHNHQNAAGGGTLDGAAIASGTVAIARLPTSIAQPNSLPNGSFDVWQQGTTINSTSPFVNNDGNYGPDRCILLGDGNNIFTAIKETTTIPTGSRAALKATVVTANKKGGWFFPLSKAESAALIANNASAQVKLRTGASSTLTTYRWALLTWTGTADAITRDCVSGANWGAAGVDPTLAANWNYESVPAGITLTTSFVIAKLENIALDTASAVNAAIFIWTDDVTTTAGDLAYIADLKIEPGSRSTDFILRDVVEEEILCYKRFVVLGGATSQRCLTGRADGTQIALIGYDLSVAMDGQPTASIVGSNLRLNDGLVNVLATTIATNFSSGRTMTLNVNAAAATLTVGKSVFFDFNDTVSFIVLDLRL